MLFDDEFLLTDNFLYKEYIIKIYYDPYNAYLGAVLTNVARGNYSFSGRASVLLHEAWGSPIYWLSYSIAPDIQEQIEKYFKMKSFL